MAGRRVEVKACRCCSKSLPLSQFTKNSAKKDGLSIYCRPCMSDKNRANYETHRDNRLQKGKDYHKRNKEKRNEYTRLWRIENNDRSRELSRNYKRNNLPRYLELNRRRKALQLSRLGEISDDIVSDLFETQEGRCYYCGDKISDFHLEHKTPLSRGGFHEDSNVCLSCPSCNLRKGTKTAEEFLDAV